MFELHVSPTLDGIDHIRVGIKAKTLLGRLLCNESHTPFIHPTEGSFESLQAFYLWYGSRQQAEHVRLKMLYGPVSLTTVNRVQRVVREDFRETMSQALLLKVQQTPRLRDALVVNRLPIMRYDLDDDGDVGEIFATDDWFSTALPAIVRRLRAASGN